MSRIHGILEALFVTFLWSASFVMTKWIYALAVGPLTLSGLRYTLAALMLVPFWWAQRRRESWQEPGHSTAAPGSPHRPAAEGDVALAGSRPGQPSRHPFWVGLLLGLAGYAVAQGGQNLGLFYLEAHQVSLIMALHNNLQVLLWSALLLRESPTLWQWPAIAGALGGVLVYYYPWQFGAGDLLGALPVLAAGVGYALWIVGNRRWVQDGSALDLTLQSMAWGGGVLLALAVALEGFPQLSPAAWGWMLALAAVNTALAFTLWTHSQRVLAAFESSIINNTMLVQIALLSAFVLGESLSPVQWAGIGVVALFTLLLQLAPSLPAGRARLGGQARKPQQEG